MNLHFIRNNDAGRRKPRVTLLLICAVLASLLAIPLYLDRMRPAHSGKVRVRGVTAPLEIVRDEHAVPHIFAANEADALFGLGFVHAQDRCAVESLALAEWIGDEALSGLGAIGEVAATDADARDAQLSDDAYGGARESAV